MFVVEDDDGAAPSPAASEPLHSSYGRFKHRVDAWRRADGHARGHHFWWFVHNCVAHPLIGLLPVRAAFEFHDFTSDKINRRKVVELHIFTLNPKG